MPCIRLFHKSYMESEALSLSRSKSECNTEVRHSCKSSPANLEGSDLGWANSVLAKSENCACGLSLLASTAHGPPSSITGVPTAAHLLLKNSIKVQEPQ